MAEKSGKLTKERRFTNPRDMSYRNETSIVSWLHRWGFSSTKILNFILGLEQTSTISTIERQGKIARERTYENGLQHVFYLMPRGVMIAEARLDDDFEYPETYKEKVVSANFFHDLYTQALTAVAINRSVCMEFATPRMTGLSGKEGNKIPDVIWTGSSGATLAIEVEKDQKYAKKLDSFLAKIIESIESGSISECLIITSSKKAVQNYADALSRKSIPVWSRKSGGVWRLEREVAVRQVVVDLISIVLTPEQDMDKTIRRLEVSGDLEIWMAERSVSGNNSLD